jgi:hypothetical protein
MATGCDRGGAPAMGTFAIINFTSHRGQWSRASFKINGGKGDFHPNSLKIKRIR